jgi:hypothetical protein
VNQTRTSNFTVIFPSFLKKKLFLYTIQKETVGAHVPDSHALRCLQASTGPSAVSLKGAIRALDVGEVKPGEITIFSFTPLHPLSHHVFRSFIKKHFILYCWIENSSE